MNISGGNILGSVYGGGRLASVGTYLVETTDGNYPIPPSTIRIICNIPRVVMCLLPVWDDSMRWMAKPC